MAAGRRILVGLSQVLAEQGMDNRFSFGIIGLGVMGRNLARNFRRNGYHPVGFDLNTDLPAAEGFTVVSTLVEMAEMLPPPRFILLAVPAGEPVDSVIDTLLPHLKKGDLVIDAGNSHFKDSEHRYKVLAGQGFEFIGMGVSGGEKGALWGPSLMPGGSQSAWLRVKPALERISAKAGDGLPCVAWMGPGGAGHFVKMVHNGIEYAFMQLIAETYDLLHRAAGLSNTRLAEIFARWNERVLRSYLIESTSVILSTIDEYTRQPLVDLIRDEAEQKGTGLWASQSALDLSAAIPTINAAVDSRIISTLKNEREIAARIFGGNLVYAGDLKELILAAEQALYCGIFMSFAQGLSMLKLASREFNWGIDLAQVTRVWRDGCIIRADLLNEIYNVYRGNPNLPNLLLDESLSQALILRQPAWRHLIRSAAALGIPMLAMGSTLAYFDAYHSEFLPANLIQAQRDYFGAHTYRRLDRDGHYHTEWETKQYDPGASEDL